MAEDETSGEDGLAPPPVEGGSIAGVVTDFEDVPLTGVRVEAAATAGADLDLLPVLTDGDGAFRLEGLADGRYDLRFALGQVKARTLAVPVGTDQLRVRLARPQGILLVTRTEADLEPPAMVGFVLERHAKGRLRREHFGRTLKRRLLLWSIRPGRYTLTAWGGPYLPVRVESIDVVAQEPAPEVEVVFGAEGGAVAGHVEGGGQDGLECLVAWRRVDAPGHVPRHLTTHQTDERGRFVTRGLPCGRYRFSAWHPAHGIADVDLDVEEGETARVAITLPG